MQVVMDMVLGGIISILDIAGMAVFLMAFFENKGNRRKNLAFYTFGVLLLVIAVCFIKNGAVNVIVTSCLLLLFTTLFKTSRLQKAFAFLMYFLTIIIVEVTGGEILVSLSICEIEETLGYQITNQPLYYMIAIVSKLLILLIFAGLRLIFGKKQHMPEDRGARLQYLMMLGMAMLCFGMIVVVNQVWFQDEEYYGVCTFINVCMIFINAIVYMMYHQMWRFYSVKLEKETLENEYRYRQEYFSMLERHQQEIRTIRHDMKNRLIGILAETSDSEQAKQEIHTIMEEISSAENQLISDHPAINAVLNYKFQEAQSKGIECDLDIKVPAELALSAGDIGILLGNLLDNAIEAAEKCEPGKRFIWLKICLFNRGLVLSCTNTTFDKVRSMQTTKEDGAVHGIGLKSIDRIIEKYHGERHIHPQEDRFTTEINLWL